MAWSDNQGHREGAGGRQIAAGPLALGAPSHFRNFSGKVEKFCMENVGESDTEAIETFFSGNFFSEKALDGGGSRKSCRRGWRGGIDPPNNVCPGPPKSSRRPC